MRLTEEVALAVGAKFGLPLEAGFFDGSGYKGWGLRYLAQSSDGIGFDLLLSASHHHAEAIFRPASFGGALVRALSGAWQSDMRGWRREVESLPSALSVTVSVNGEIRNTVDPFPTDPLRELQIEAITRITDRSDEGLRDSVVAVAEACLALVLTGLETEAEFLDVGNLTEGAVTRIEANRYERSPRARRRCIEAYGAVCWVCDFDFEESYGALGVGFAEVHHRVPVSMMGGTYEVDPVRDLVPMCSNCHSMAHRRRPPVAPEELRTILGLGEKAPLPSLDLPDPPPVNIRACDADGITYIAVTIVADGETWEAVFPIDEFWSSMSMAEDGLPAVLEFGDSIVPVETRGPLIDIQFGPVCLVGDVAEWSELMKGIEGAAAHRLAAPGSHMPTYGASPWVVKLTDVLVGEL